MIVTGWWDNSGCEESQDASISTPCPKQGQLWGQTRLLRAWTSQGLKSSKEGNVMAAQKDSSSLESLSFWLQPIASCPPILQCCEEPRSASSLTSLQLLGDVCWVTLKPSSVLKVGLMVVKAKSATDDTCVASWSPVPSVGGSRRKAPGPPLAVAEVVWEPVQAPDKLWDRGLHPCGMGVSLRHLLVLPPVAAKRLGCLPRHGFLPLPAVGHLYFLQACRWRDSPLPLSGVRNLQPFQPQDTPCAPQPPPGPSLCCSSWRALSTSPSPPPGPLPSGRQSLHPGHLCPWWHVRGNKQLGRGGWAMARGVSSPPTSPSSLAASQHDLFCWCHSHSKVLNWFV